LFIKTIRGATICVEIDLSSSVEDLKMKVEEKERIPIMHQVLMFCGIPLKPKVSLNSQGISKGSTIDISLSIRGGAKISITFESQKKNFNVPESLLKTLDSTPKILYLDKPNFFLNIEKFYHVHVNNQKFYKLDDKEIVLDRVTKSKHFEI
jgi:hypothetical protein